MATVTYPTLEHVAMNARPYPTHLLDGCKTGLCLFSAAFLGHNDVIHFAEAGIETTCVDTDEDRLLEMAALYSPEWDFVTQDAWEYATLNIGRKWDVVSVDTWTGDLTSRSLASLHLWTELANRAVTATLTRSGFGAFRTPEGWTASMFQRSGDVYWLCLIPQSIRSQRAA